ncbi:hypothetical protein MuYL_1629 [Mucilaginibacter xinganensis]|uniref:Uncharacterized protein n=1 Tax=Mucilaginibacter xinganensis TaxID=1234841 RepID=A0A223NUI6_9SPHI|nr:hypothetical protein MuYL_1629 [Mucilaginibacter xinganensis]
MYWFTGIIKVHLLSALCMCVNEIVTKRRIDLYNLLKTGKIWQKAKPVSTNN